MNTASLLVLALAVFGASAAPCMNQLLVGVNNGLNGEFVSSGNTGVSSGVVTIGNGLNPVSVLNAVTAVNRGVSNQVVALQAPNTYVQTGVVENPTAFVPPVLPSTSVSKSCHCVKTLVRPQVRNEVYTVPSVDRVSRVVTTPLVDVTSSGNMVNNGRLLETVLPATLSSGLVGSNNGLVSSNNGLFGGVSGVLSGVSNVNVLGHTGSNVVSQVVPATTVVGNSCGSVF